MSNTLVRSVLDKMNALWTFNIA